MTRPPLPSKDDVRRSFDHAAPTYDDNAFLQREIADRLFERLDYIKVVPQHVLELGCGTGYVTRKLRQRYVDAAMTAVDIAPAMCRLAEAQMPKGSRLKRLFQSTPPTTFVCADAETIPLGDESVDLVVSSLTLQWCDPEAVARESARVLRPHGLLMFTTFGPDTLKELRAAFRAVDDKPHVNTFVDMHDLGDILLAAGFADPVMDQEVVTITYSDLKPMLRELKGIGAHNVLPDRATGLMGKQRWAALMSAYERFRRPADGKLPATYEVVYGHAWKPAIGKRKNVDGQQVIGLGEFKRMVQKS
jgi:malonyl-CoA O-methyltransferase